MVEKVLNMKFKDLAGRKFSFAVKDIKPKIEDSAIVASMDSIITSVFIDLMILMYQMIVATIEM